MPQREEGEDRGKEVAIMAVLADVLLGGGRWKQF
jgi:hypothetical protein